MADIDHARQGRYIIALPSRDDRVAAESLTMHAGKSIDGVQAPRYRNFEYLGYDMLRRYQHGRDPN